MFNLPSIFILVGIHDKAKSLSEIPQWRFKFARSNLDCPSIADIYIYTPRGAHTPSSEANVIVPYLISIIDITTGAMSSASNSHVPLVILGAGVTGFTIATCCLWLRCDFWYYDNCERYAGFWASPFAVCSFLKILEVPSYTNLI
jgi:hypothetical protein